MEAYTLVIATICFLSTTAIISIVVIYLKYIEFKDDEIIRNSSKVFDDFYTLGKEKDDV